MFNWIKELWISWQRERAHRRRLKEIKKRDPFTY
jgi:hypothetical protein